MNFSLITAYHISPFPSSIKFIPIQLSGQCWHSSTLLCLAASVGNRRQNTHLTWLAKVLQTVLLTNHPGNQATDIVQVPAAVAVLVVTAPITAVCHAKRLFTLGAGREGVADFAVSWAREALITCRQVVCV